MGGMEQEVTRQQGISYDAFCSECGYNLRTRPILGRCPECGSEYDSRPVQGHGILQSRDARLPAELYFGAMACGLIAFFALYHAITDHIPWAYFVAVPFVIMFALYAWLSSHKTIRLLRFRSMVRHMETGDDD